MDRASPRREPERVAGIAEHERRPLDRDVDQARSAEQARHAVSQVAVAQPVVAPEPLHPSDDAGVGAVDHERLLVGVDDHHASPRPRHAHELGQSPLGIGQVLERAIGAASVEGAVRERQRVRVAPHEVAAAPGGLVDHRRRRVEPHTPAGQRPGVLPGATPHVEQPRLVHGLRRRPGAGAARREQLQRALLVRLHERPRGHRVHPAGRAGGVGGTVDVAVGPAHTRTVRSARWPAGTSRTCGRRLPTRCPTRPRSRTVTTGSRGRSSTAERTAWRGR